MGKSKRTSIKKHSRKQKVYKMKGCSNKTCKIYLGGNGDVPLAYTGAPIFSVPNPNLAYTGKGGSSCGLSNNANIPINTNASNPAYPNTGPISGGVDTIFNNPFSQRGGCGCSLIGGKKLSHKKGCSCNNCLKHRDGCLCSECKNRRQSGGMSSNGLVGESWTPPVKGWPGVDGIPGNRNYISQNLYNNDPQTSMVSLGANPPFLKGGKKRKQRGGTLSNFMGQDLINLGRQFQFGVGSAYNALAGYPPAVDPLPWRDQLTTKLPINPAII